MKNKYEIGYKKPPLEKQFKKGFSGNIKGRTKGSKTINAILKEVSNEKIVLKDGKRITKIKAAATQVANGAAQGDIRKTKLLFDLLGKAYKANIAEKFLNKFMEDGYISEQSVYDYVNGLTEIPDLEKGQQGPDLRVIVAASQEDKDILEEV